MNGVVRLKRSGPVVSASDGELSRLRAHFEERHFLSLRVVCELPNTGFGDAVPFPIDPRFEHRVLDVEGDTPKTALAGWFNSKSDPRYLFTRGAAGA